MRRLAMAEPTAKLVWMTSTRRRAMSSRGMTPTAMVVGVERVVPARTMGEGRRSFCQFVQPPCEPHPNLRESRTFPAQTAWTLVQTAPAAHDVRRQPGQGGGRTHNEDPRSRS